MLLNAYDIDRANAYQIESDSMCKYNVKVSVLPVHINKHFKV